MNTWGYWDHTPKKPKKGKTPWNHWGAETSAPKQPKSDKQEYVAKGFDGRRISVSLPSSSHGDSQPTLDQYKEIMKTLAMGKALTPAQQKLLEDSPRDVLRDEQRSLNQRRKRQNKERNLEKKLEQNRRDYEAWLETQRQILSQEKARFLSEQERIQKELELLKSEMDDEDLEANETMDDLLTAPQPGQQSDFNVKQFEDRMMAAEQNAYHAQQSMLMMQTQLHQYHCALMNQGMASSEATGPSTSMSPTCNSPQLPKGVKQAMLKQNHVPKASKTRAAKTVPEVASTPVEVDSDADEEGDSKKGTEL